MSPLELPTFLAVVGISITQCGPSQPDGFRLNITYQVMDQWGRPLDEAGLVPLENISNSGMTWTNGAGIPNNYVKFTRATNAAGQFLDPNVGECSDKPIRENPTQSIILSGFGGAPIRVNNFVWFANTNGTGSITNGGDINVTVN
jgi:hypothetical protein